MTEKIFKPGGPVIKAFMEDNESFVRCIIGPFGSGKTSAAVVEVLRRAMLQAPGPDGIRHTRWAFVRNTFAELKSTTLKSWEMWCPRNFGKLTIGGSPITHRIQAPGLDMEVLFVPLDNDADVRKLLSMELTGAVIDEAREVPMSVLDALTGRVNRYPAKPDGGCTWNGILLVSNPGDTENWIYKTFYPTGLDEKGNPKVVPEKWKIYRQPSARSPEVENLENLNDGYYDNMIGGKDPEWLKVYIDGEFGFLIEGKPVYPSFRDSVHVPQARIAPLKGIGLTLGADWGLTPAAAICQQWPNGRIVCLDEYVCTSTGIKRFALELAAYMKANYAEFDVTMALGDPAGMARGQDEERTCFDIMNVHTPWKWRPAPTNDPTMRIEAVDSALSRMVDGQAGFQLNPGCGTLRKGFAGGYHFAKVQTGGGMTFSEAPRKNQYSHPHDALQYAMLGMGGADAVLNRDRSRNRPRLAEGMDDRVMADDGPRQGIGSVCGNGRPAHMGPGTRRRVVLGGQDIDVYS